MTLASAEVAVLMPVYRDWESAERLVRELDAVLAKRGTSAVALLVDDASPEGAPPPAFTGSFSAFREVTWLRLRRNLGHQRAIAVGLAWLSKHGDHPAIVVMDADGEDKPEDVARLLDRFDADGRKRVVFAERTRRSEGVLFTVFYQLYRVLHRLLTGIAVKVGNFSVLPRSALDALVVSSELWNHYAAAVVKCKLPASRVPTSRGRRYAGASSMSFVPLVVHGLSAMSVFGDVVGVRLLVAALVTGLVAFVGIVGAVFVRVATDLAIPGWATYTVGIFVVLLGQAVIVSLALAFAVLAARGNLTLIPLREHEHFIGATGRLV